MAGAFGVSLDGSGYAARWDADTRLISNDSGQQDRSLVDGLSWAVQGGGLDAYYQVFDFGDGTTAVQFGGLVDDAFNAWMSIDEDGTGSTAAFTFNMRDEEAVGNFYFGEGVLNGAEIDLLSHPIFPLTQGGFTQRRIEYPGAGGVTLTSGVENYGGGAIVGADIFMSSARTWTGDEFRLVLAHELGIALGLIDVDVVDNTQQLPLFWDDNYDPAAVTETLTNAWSGQIDPYAPEATPGLVGYSITNDSSGFDKSGVDLLMETQLPESFLGLANPLSADEYAGRQFLYPVVPEADAVVLVLVGGTLLGFRRRR